MEKTVSSEYEHSIKNNTYRRRSLSQTEREERGTYGKTGAQHKRHSLPPAHAHHQPISKFNAEFWMQDFRKKIMETLFREERFKSFQKRRNIGAVIDGLMDTEDDEIFDWKEQKQIVESAHVLQYYGASLSSTTTLAAATTSNPGFVPILQHRDYQQSSSPFFSPQNSQPIQPLTMSSLNVFDLQKIQWQQQQQEFVNNLPAEIAKAVQTKNLPPEFYQFRERHEEY
ncbi:8703_t:CDS:2 [Ambispora gerdemannii]|uniref:8703_t:CDS:1 n=1 Tax=Ambispora gerdemannii TaxID=144530 RepID=A0A9N8W693_9GLOM|nr:8703_t:CDS:2 [Ambispora gerdemannii]